MAGIAAKCWSSDGYWIQFNLFLGNYDNIITFLDAQKLGFLAELQLDFSTIPLSLHGKGNSYNLLEYLANNTDDNSLIANFLAYFLNSTTDMRYLDGTKMNFTISEATGWQNLQLTINEPYITLYLTVDSDLYTCDDDIITCDQTEI